MLETLSPSTPVPQIHVCVWAKWEGYYIFHVGGCIQYKCPGKWGHFTFGHGTLLAFNPYVRKWSAFSLSTAAWLLICAPHPFISANIDIPYLLWLVVSGSPNDPPPAAFLQVPRNLLVFFKRRNAPKYVFQVFIYTISSKNCGEVVGNVYLSRNIKSPNAGSQAQGLDFLKSNIWLHVEGVPVCFPQQATGAKTCGTSSPLTSASQTCQGARHTSPAVKHIWFSALFNGENIKPSQVYSTNILSQ